MKFQRLLIFIFLTCGLALVTMPKLSAQSNDELRLSGNLMLNGNFFIRDSLIGAANLPQYDNQLYGADGWLTLNADYKGFQGGLRFDMFQNSQLLNPMGSYTAQGIGRWFIKKDVGKLGVSAGYLYDIIGSGIIFRAYEERPLAIDQALFGLRLTYDVAPDWQVKAFTGRQKKQFELAESAFRGIALDGFVAFDSSGVTLAPGFGAVARTVSEDDMQNFVSTIDLYLEDDVFEPKYNTYAFSLYNTLTAGPFVWYVEGAYKTKDNVLSPFEERQTASGSTVVGRYILEPGSVIYTSLSYAKKGLGLSVEGKRTENFDFRTRPQEQGNQGLVHFLPPMTRVNTYRLPSRYAAATQFIGEMAFQGDIRYRVNRKLSLALNVSNISDLNDEQLYREVFTEVYYKYKRKWTLTAGAQYQEYNQEIYQVKPGVPFVTSITPYFDFLYKLGKKRAIRVEGQVMRVEKDKGVRGDYGNWAFGLIEYSVAPHWTFTLSDMYNVSPGKISPENSDGEKEKIHYPRVDVFYAHKASRYSLSYVKQVQGIVCSGGICRLEPAFSGVKVSVNTSF